MLQIREPGCDWRGEEIGIGRVKSGVVWGGEGEAMVGGNLCGSFIEWLIGKIRMWF